jgi:hypothetical protein
MRMHPVAFTLGAIVFAVALAALAMAYVIDDLSRGLRPAPASGAVLNRTLGGTELHIPAGWFRTGDQSAEGFAKEVDLTVSLPLGPDAAPRSIDLTLLPRSQARPSAALLDGVYLHLFMPEQLDGPPGLVGKPLVAQEGYEGETVWYDALSPDPFVAKCDAAVSPQVPARCIRMVYLGPGIAAVYVFDQDVLGNWRQFDTQMHTVLTRIGAA